MRLTCEISNANGKNFDHIMFRKFFQIIFMNEDMKRIDIYTATVLGGAKHEKKTGYGKYYSEIDNKFKIKFKIKDNGNAKSDINTEDLTDEFLREIDKTKLIWGKDSKTVFEQNEIEEKIRLILKTYKNHNVCKSFKNQNRANETESEGKNRTKLGEQFTEISENSNLKPETKDCNQQCDQQCDECTICKECKDFTPDLDDTIIESDNYIYLADEKSKDIALAVKGNVEINDFDSTYEIGGKAELPIGVEVLNWIHTKIEYEKKQDFDLLDYTIIFPGGDNTILTPDFTVYIGPPEGYVINLDGSTVKIGNQNKTPRDIFQEVASYEELYYDSWKNDCNIMSKKMHRVLKEKIFSSSNKIFTDNKIQYVINFKDDYGKDNLHFLLGIIISAILAFGIDFTRMQTYKSFFLPILFVPELQWVGTWLFLSFVFFRRMACKKSVKKTMRYKITSFISLAGVISLGVWFVAFLTYQAYNENYIPWEIVHDWIEKFKYNDIPLLHLCKKWYALSIGWILCGCYSLLTLTVFKRDYHAGGITHKRVF